MHFPFPKPLLWGTLLAAAPAPGHATADLIRLKNGGELRGSIQEAADADPAAPLTIVTLTGAVVSVDRGSVEFVIPRPLIVEEYETRARTVEDSVKAHWELAEWCRENRLADEREVHLRAVIDLDPDHRRAHQALGHSQYDGRWMTRDDYMKSRGYVKHRGKYITQQELELIEKSKEELEAEKEWFKKVRVWAGWLTGRDADRAQQALAELRNIADPNAVPALVQFMQDDDNKLVRNLYVEIVGGIPGRKAVRPLVQTSLRDVDYELRSQALDALDDEQFTDALPYFLEALRDESNMIVQAAGAALERAADDSVVPYLIEALVTTHRYKVEVPAGNSYTFSSGGSPLILPPEVEQALLAGQYPNGIVVHRMVLPGENITKTVAIRRDHQNSKVLKTLIKLTGQNLGYDERTWKLWWAAQKAKPVGAAPTK